METRRERVYLETHRHRIAGTLTMSAGGYRSRLSDVLNASERDFIALTDATVELLDRDGPGTFHPFLAVGRTQIVLAIPEEGAEEAPAAAPLGAAGLL